MSIATTFESLESRCLLSTSVLPSVDETIAFSPTKMIADPLRDLIYVLDDNAERVRVLDMSTNQLVRSRGTDGPPSAGAISPAGDRLYVSFGIGTTIDVLRLPDLKPLGTLHTSKPVEQMVVAANGRLHALEYYSDVSGPDVGAVSPGRQDFPPHRFETIDVATDTIIAARDRAPFSELRTNSSGTRLFATYISDVVSSDRQWTQTIDEYDVASTKLSSGLPRLLRTRAIRRMRNAAFAVDAKYQRVYSSDDGNKSALIVTDLATGLRSTWEVTSNENDVVSDVVLHEADDSIAVITSKGITRLRRDDGQVIQTVPTTEFQRSVALSAGGRLLIAQHLPDTGSSQAPTMTTVGATTSAFDGHAPTPKFSSLIFSSTDLSFDATETDPGYRQFTARYVWDYGDGSPHESGAKRRHTFASPGTYHVRLIVTNSSNEVRALTRDITAGDTTQSSSIGGRVFNDIGMDGVRHSNDPYVKDVTVFIDADNDGVLDAGERSTRTHSDGSYAFLGLPAGTYVVRQILGAVPMIQTKPAKGWTVTLDGGNAVTGRDFGRATSCSLVGTLWYIDAAEAVPNRLVWVDFDADGVLDAGEPHTRTRSGTSTRTWCTSDRRDRACGAMMRSEIETLEGRTLLSALDARFNAYQYSSEQFFFDASVTGGDYTKLVWHFGDGKTGKGVAITHTFAAPGTYRVKLTAYDSLSNRDDFALTYVTGDTKKTASISGTIFLDENYNERRDKGEEWLQSQAYIDANDNGLLDGDERIASDDFYGGFRFLNLKAGTYIVRRGLRDSGYVSTLGADGYRITLHGGEASPDHVFGEAQGSYIKGKVVGEDPIGHFVNFVAAKVYLDGNNNGVLDAGERTTSGGNYTFGGLTAGTYYIRVIGIDGSAQYSPANDAPVRVKVDHGKTVTAQTIVWRRTDAS